MILKKLPRLKHIVFLDKVWGKESDMAEQRGYGRAHLYRQNANWEVQRTNHFEVFINAFKKSDEVKIGNGETINDIWEKNRNGIQYPNAQNDQRAVMSPIDADECFRLAVKSAFLPSHEVGTEEIKHGNETVKVATSYSVNGGDIVCRDAIAADIERLLWGWFNQVVNVESTMLMGLVVDYKKNLSLVQYSPDGSIARSWECLGCFPTSFSSDGLDMDSANLKSITMTISVDLAVPKRFDDQANAPTCVKTENLY